MPKKTEAVAPADAAPIAPVPSQDELTRLADGAHSGPHAVLGQHPIEGTEAVVIRALRPLARQVVAVLASGARVELGHVGSGVWQGVSVAGLQP